MKGSLQKSQACSGIPEEPLTQTMYDAFVMLSNYQEYSL